MDTAVRTCVMHRWEHTKLRWQISTGETKWGKIYKRDLGKNEYVYYRHSYRGHGRMGKPLS